MTTPLDLLGCWQLQRTIDDRMAGERLAVTGQTELTHGDDGRVRWSEHGTLLGAGVETPVSRTLFIELRDDGWWVTFSDGRDFHPWRTEQQVVHPCAADTYRGTIVVHDANSWQIKWDVSGPAKDYTMVSTLTRHAR